VRGKPIASDTVDKQARQNRTRRDSLDGIASVSYTAGAQVTSKEIRKLASNLAKKGMTDSEVYKEMVATADALDNVVRRMPAVFVFVDAEDGTQVEGSITPEVASDLMCQIEEFQHANRQ
jgi:hypothetical protein